MYKLPTFADFFIFTSQKSNEQQNQGLYLRSNRRSQLRHESSFYASAIRSRHERRQRAILPLFISRHCIGNFDEDPTSIFRH